jgi:hypothetical protein
VHLKGPYGEGISGDGTGFIAGPMTPVPADWQAALGGEAITGQCCIPIIGRTSTGPAAFAFHPADIGTKRSVPTTALLYYVERVHARIGGWGSSPPALFNGGTYYAGVAFIAGTRSVLFFMRHGTGPFCYGEGAACGDSEDDSKGTHAYPYVNMVYAYDASALKAVHDGKKQPWDPVPYATWAIPLPNPWSLTAVGYDPTTQRLFLLQGRTMNVFKVAVN